MLRRARVWLGAQLVRVGTWLLGTPRDFEWELAEDEEPCPTEKRFSVGPVVTLSAEARRMVAAGNARSSANNDTAERDAPLRGSIHDRIARERALRRE